MGLILAFKLRKFMALALLAGMVLASFGARPADRAWAQAPDLATPLLQSATQTQTPVESETATPLLQSATQTETPAATETPTPTPSEPLLQSAAQTATPEPATPTPETPTPPPPLQTETISYPGPLLSDGQFVYGPNVGSFDVVDYMTAQAPQLAGYAETLYGRAEYYSINPKVYLTLMEMSGGLVSNPAASPEQVENPFGLGQGDFTAQLDALSETLFAAYYLHLYNYSILPADQRGLPPVTLTDGSTFQAPGAANAGSYAAIAALATMFDSAGMASALEYQQPGELCADLPAPVPRR